MLSDFPSDERCFVDANILYYHFVETPPLSDVCSDFLKRIEDGEVIGYSSAGVLAEAVHKVMLAEAVSRWGLSRQGLAHRLQRRPELVSQLTEHLKVVPTVRALNFQIESITSDLLESATHISVRHSILTNDALIIAVMQQKNLTHLVTNDDDFNLIPGLSVWKPG